MSKKTTPKDPLTGRPLSALSLNELVKLNTALNRVLIAKKAEEGRQ